MKSSITHPLRVGIMALLVTALLTQGCNNATRRSSEVPAATDHQAIAMIPSKTAFQQTIDGKKTDLYVLTNNNGMQAAITNYGGRLVSLVVPLGTDSATDVVVGFDSVTAYQHSTEPYFGATIGRFGNRIAKGRFALDGTTYTLFTNNGPNTLHGGKKGFQDVVWDATQKGDSLLQLRYKAKDMEEGFPGNLDVTVTYTLTANNELKIDYQATTDKTTVLNLTNHAFFNLNGKGTITNHLLMINADRYTPVDSTLIPTGQLLPVAGTPFDFRNPVTIGQHIDEQNEQLTNGKGYDHNFVLNKTSPNALTTAAVVTGDLSGISMEVITTEPGIQLYSGNFMQSKNSFRGGVKDDFRTAFCLETQHFPDSPNQPAFPSTVLKPGQQYSSQSLYRFSSKQ